MRPRSETFFVYVDQPFAETFLPKPAARTVRPVRQIAVYIRNDLQRDPYTFLQIADAFNLSNATITLRDSQDRELVKDAPVWMFGQSVQFAKPGPFMPTMHARRDLADLPVDPQRTSVRINNAAVTSTTLAIEFIYAP